MKKFRLKDIKESFVQEQIKENLVELKKALTENKSLLPKFLAFAEKQGFSLKSYTVNTDSFKFAVYLHDELNEEFPANVGEIVFEKTDFELAIAALPVVETKKSTKKVSVLPKTEEE